jgi:hypothetical protein
MDGAGGAWARSGTQGGGLSLQDRKKRENLQG